MTGMGHACGLGLQRINFRCQFIQWGKVHIILNEDELIFLDVSFLPP